MDRNDTLTQAFRQAGKDFDRNRNARKQRLIRLNGTKKQFLPP